MADFRPIRHTAERALLVRRLGLKMMQGRGQIYARRADYLRVAWSAPMRDLASKVGISDVGLKKRLAAAGLSVPPQGYWNKLKAGRPVPRPPRAPPRGPGMSELIAVPAALDALFVSVPPPAGDGPFASARVPEDLEDLRSGELTAIGKGYSMSGCGPLHPAVAALLNDEADCVFRPGRGIPDPAFTTPPSVRHLALINAIYRTLEKRGHSGKALRNGRYLHCHVLVGGSWVKITAAVVGHKFPPNTNLISAIRRAPEKALLSLEIEGGLIWTDDAANSLDGMIAEISADIIVAGEAKYRRDLTRAAGKDEAYNREIAEGAARKKAEYEALRKQARDAARTVADKAETLRLAAAAAKAMLDDDAGPAAPYAMSAWIRSVDALGREVDRFARRLSIT